MARMSLDDNHVMVAMSGGVDSAVAAALLSDEGYHVTGVFLCLKLEQAGDRACCSPQAAEDARQVAEALGIELISMPVVSAFAPIMEDFVAEYVAGRTPNPCVHCNARIKFGRLFDMADSVGAAHLATGHYARTIEADGHVAIARAKTLAKDQSYALFGIDRSRLGRIRLPIGEHASKAATREIARRLQLPGHAKPDSQEVCFVPNDDYAALLAERAPEALRSGPITNARGEVLGEHDGYARFTIGQRRGLRVAAGEPMYVTAIDPATATVTIGPKSEVMSRSLRASAANWHADVPDDFEATVQIRYNHAGAPARVKRTGETEFTAEFSEPVSAITPGQAAVVYDGDRLMGGGWID